MAHNPEQATPERDYTPEAFGMALLQSIQANRQRPDAQYDADPLGTMLALDNGSNVVIYAAVTPDLGHLILADYRQWPGGQTRMSVELFAGHVDVSGVNCRGIPLDSAAAYDFAYALLGDLLPPVGTDDPWQTVMQRAGPIQEIKKPAPAVAQMQIGHLAIQPPAA